MASVTVPVSVTGFEYSTVTSIDEPNSPLFGR